MKKIKFDKDIRSVLQTVNKDSKRGSVFHRFQWPDEVSIISSSDLHEEAILGGTGLPQCAWGHVNNEFRSHLNIPLYDAQMGLEVWYRHFTHVCSAFQRNWRDKVMTKYLRIATEYNATWCTLGYTVNQDDRSLSLSSLTLLDLIQFSPATVPEDL